MQIATIRFGVNFMCIKCLFRKWRELGRGQSMHESKPDKEILIPNKNVESRGALHTGTRPFINLIAYEANKAILKLFYIFSS